LDVALLAYKQLVSKIILIVGDSDFVPASKLARRESIEFILDPMHKEVRDLLEHPERHHCSRNPKWGPSDFGCEK